MKNENGIKIEVGQVWKDRHGASFEIVATNERQACIKCSYGVYDDELAMLGSTYSCYELVDMS